MSDKIQRSDGVEEPVQQKGSAGAVANEGVVTDDMLDEQEQKSGGAQGMNDAVVGGTTGDEAPQEVGVPREGGEQADAYTEGAPDEPPGDVTPDQRDAVAGRARESDKRAAE